MKRNRLSLSAAVAFALVAASPASAQCTHQPVPSSIPASFKLSVTLNDGTGGVELGARDLDAIARQASRQDVHRELHQISANATDLQPA